MTDWQQPHWSGRPQPRQDARPKLKAGVFAKLARLSAAHRLAVLSVFLLAALSAAGFAAARLSVDPEATPQFTFDKQTETARQSLNQRFPELDSSFLALVGNPDPRKARETALAISAALGKDTSLFQTAFVPGTGPFYDRFAILLQDRQVLANRVELARQMQPLYHAVAAQPTIEGLTALVVEIARSVSQGRSPPGLEGLLNAVSAGIESELAGQLTPLDWTELAGLSAASQSQSWFVIATPAPGRAVEAAGAARRITDRLPGVAWLWPNSALGVTADLTRDFAVPVGLGALAVMTILYAGLGALRLAFPAALGSAVTVSLAAGAAALVSPRLDAATWSFAGAVLAPALLLNTDVVMAHAQARLRGAGVVHAVMLAAQRRGPLLAAFASIFAAWWLSWLVRQIPSLAQFAVIALIGTLIALLTSLTFMPAALAAFDHDESEPEVHWMDAAIAAGSTSMLRQLGQLAAMVLVAAGMFSIIFLPSIRLGEKLATPEPPVMLEIPDARGAIHILAPAGEGARAIAGQLAALPQAGAVRWIEQFMPSEGAAKIAGLRQLEGVFPTVLGPAAEQRADLAVTLTDLGRALQLIAGSPVTDAGLRDASNRLRWSIGQFTNRQIPAPGRVALLEAALFGGIPRLAATADRLAILEPPQLSDLEEGLRRRFVSPDGQWRIEIMPKPGVTALNFAAAVRKLFPQASGEPILALSRNEIMHHEAGLALAAALTAALFLAFVALRDPAAWLVTVAPLAFFFTLSAATLAGQSIGVNSALLAAICAVAALVLCSAIIMAAGLDGKDKSGGNSSTAYRAGLLPLLVFLGSVAPLALSSYPPVAEFGAVVGMLLGVGVAVNLILVPAATRFFSRMFRS